MHPACRVLVGPRLVLPVVASSASPFSSFSSFSSTTSSSSSSCCLCNTTKSCGNFACNASTIASGHRRQHSRSFFAISSIHNAACRANYYSTSSIFKERTQNNKKLGGTTITSHFTPVLLQLVSSGQSRGFHHTSSVAAPRKDFYESLGVAKNAPKEDIKKAYYTLVKKYHPDVNKDDKQAASKFQEVQSAYEILSDDSKRAAYDRFGHAGVDQAAAAEEAAANGGSGGGGGFGGFGGFGGASGAGGEYVDAEELFSRVFGGLGGMGGGRGGAGGRGGPQRGSDIQASVTISFMEAVNGTTRSITSPVHCKCETCKGTGSADGKEPVTCTSCRGTGQTASQSGMYTVLTTCRRCSGAGTMVKNPCRSCGGNGTVRKPKTVQVTVPPGVDTGMNLRLPNEGDAGEHGAPAGHFYVRVNVEPDDFFQRSGADIHVRVPISVPLAALGGEVAVPTVKGEVQLKIPQGSQPGDKLVMKGKGLKNLTTGGTGSQYVHLDVEVPKQLTPKQKELLQALRDEEVAAAAAAGGGAGSGSSGTTGTAGGGSAASSWGAKLRKIMSRLQTATAK